MECPASLITNCFKCLVLRWCHLRLFIWHRKGLGKWRGCWYRKYTSYHGNQLRKTIEYWISIVLTLLIATYIVICCHFCRLYFFSFASCSAFFLLEKVYESAHEIRWLPLVSNDHAQTQLHLTLILLKKDLHHTNIRAMWGCDDGRIQGFVEKTLKKIPIELSSSKILVSGKL